ncbi:MAG: hypothetical protein IKP09_06355 [Lentisphaeria bacterium]|jgi:hypothetical protein|nr:hypothetical protein [Lentisphaeria bacterium]
MKFFRMMKGLMPILAAAATTACAQTAAESKFDPNVVKIPADKKEFHIFLLTGQSNMEGAGYPVLPQYLTGTTQVLELNDKMEWVKNVAPYGRGYGPGEAFALHYAKLHPDVTVGLIHAARGGRSMRELSKGGRDNTDRAPNYDNLIKKIKFAQEQGEVKAMLWHQGESDTGNRNYINELNKLVTDVRTDIGIADLPLLVGELGRYVNWTDGFNRMIQDVESKIENCKLISSKGLMHRGDELHISGYSVEIFGCRYLDAYLKMREPETAKKFQPLLAEVEKKMAEYDARWVTVENGDMTMGEDRPLGWEARRWDPIRINPHRDTEVYASAPASLRIENLDPANALPSVQEISTAPGADGIGTWIRDVAGTHVKVSCKVKNEGYSKVTIRIRGENSGFQRCLDLQLFDATDAKEWTSYSGEFDIPAQAIRDRIGIMVEGKGKAWLDDVVIEKVKNGKTIPDTKIDVEYEKKMNESFSKL